jgi:hypothetical protein
MTDNASLKIDRAAKHLAELNELFRKARPFVFVIESNTKTNKRILRPKKNKTVINDAGLIAGDVVHNLRSALDHAYWDIVSPFCTTDVERRRVQFPFTEKANSLDNLIQYRMAHYAGTGFYCGMRKLRPYGEPSGNELLDLINGMDIIDKHKLLIPTDDHIKLPTDLVRQFAPEFPFQIGPGASFSNCTFEWPLQGSTPEELGNIKIPTFHIFERELDISFDIVFRVGSLGKVRPVIRTLNELINTARQTITRMAEAAASY